MKELFDNLPRLTLDDSVDYLIDTCFFIWIFEHHKEKDFLNFLKENKCAVTSFNVEELVHVEHKLHDNIKVSTRKFFHKVKNLFVLEVPIHPGDPIGEHNFVKLISQELNMVEHDPSDAVMLAAAIKTGADVLTRDKHDVFNARLENFLQKYNIKVLNKF
ncbi:PIN domain-containing protein [archaeon]|nr:PIN domain-containing protein [archaeon]MBL7057592.1 PIN domain-containing protein [Candidatus Woesearchaeota archaeon]